MTHLAPYTPRVHTVAVLHHVAGEVLPVASWNVAVSERAWQVELHPVAATPAGV